MKRLLHALARGYGAHHASSKVLLEGIGVVGAIAFPAFYLLRFTGKLPPLYNDLPLRLLAGVLCLFLATRRFWPKSLRPYYLPYSYFTVFYCLAFFLPFTLLQNKAATPSIVNVVVSAVLIMLLTDWPNTLLMLLAGYVSSICMYWLVHPEPSLPLTFLVWWIPLCTVLVAGGSLSKYVEKRNELERLRRLYAALAGSVAHEMRAPFGQIQFALETMASVLPLHATTAPSLTLAQLDQMQTSLSQGWQAVRRGLQSISLTLQYLKQAPADSSSLQLLSAQECVHKAVNEFAYESPEQRASVHVQAHADFTFRGDETTVVLILFNLLKNALYYLPLAPQATITLRVEAGATNRIVVHDTGPGIAPALRGRLFEEFQTAGKAEGTGLGLAFCRRAMRSFGGDIECESEAGRFTTFTLTFPHANQAAASSATSPPPTRDRALSGRRVLVVDDSALNRAFARARLIGLGAHVTEATHADEALRMVREGAPADAILMDMNMPGMSGIDATRALRALHGPAARIPVMILTADPTPSARQKALAAGADAFLVKPLESELLREELCRLIA